MKLIKYLLLPCLLAAIVLVCFARTLGSYFLADDFTQIAYVSSIFKGNLHALLSSFTGNYMNIPVMKIYRPCLLLSLVGDYALWGTKAFGYFLTDILLMISASIMLYFLLIELTRSWNKGHSTLFSFFSAALFASCPLHCESISFISGRDNVMCGFFYLLSIFSFVKSDNSRSKIWLIIGVASFWLAILSKEMAIGLLFTVMALRLFLPEAFKSKVEPFQERLFAAFKISIPLWISTVLYLLIRFLALGTLIGGYTGGIGAGLMSTLTQRWTNPGTLFKIAFPLNIEAIAGADNYVKVLCALYAALGVLIVIRLLSGKFPLRWLGFILFWMLTTILPLYQLWALGENLAGSRFFFFYSIAMSLLIPLLLFAPLDKFAGNKSTLQRIEGLGVIVITLFVIVSINITCKNNIAWVYAGKQTKACLLEGQKLAEQIAPEKKVVLLGIPKEHNGAHVIYNSDTFNAMMTGPFSKADYREKFITFDPVFYGPSHWINNERLKQVLSESNVAYAMVWNKDKLSFDPLYYPSVDDLNKFRYSPSSQSLISNASFPGNDQIWINDSNGCGLLIAPLNIDPYQFDFIEFTIKTRALNQLVSVFWKGSGNNNLNWYDYSHPVQILFSSQSKTKIRMRLSDHWNWFSQGKINQLKLSFLPCQSFEISDVELLSANSLAPIISVLDVQPDNMGVYAVGKEGITLNFDASLIKDCTAVRVEVSKPNYSYEGITQENNEMTLMKMVQPICKGQITISRDSLSSGYYQIHAIGLNKEGNIIGEYSDPITIRP